MSNKISTVHKMYDCFAVGDVPGVLAIMSDDIHLDGGSDPKLTGFGGQFDGKEGATRFFTAIGTGIETTNFVASNLREEGGRVVNDILHEGIARPTGKPFSAKVRFSWGFNEAGQPNDWVGNGPGYDEIDRAFSN